MSAITAEDVEQLLPQTQCRKCGYDGCKPYAEAIVKQQAEINQCPPGGQQTIDALAKALNKKVIPLNTELGTERNYLIAKIDEEQCIGCVKCIRACPVDAIIGAAKQMHVIINEYCTGCELCIASCPVDCIDMIKAPSVQTEWFSGYSEDKLDIRLKAKSRYENRSKRLAIKEETKRLEREKKQQEKDRQKDLEQKQSFIQQAIKRSKSRRLKNS